MVMFTWGYHVIKVLIYFLYHCDINAISSTNSLVNVQIRICQLPVANVRDARKLRILTTNFSRCVCIESKIVRETSNIMHFLMNVPLCLRLGLFYKENWPWCKKKRITDLAMKISLNLSVHSVRSKCYHLKDFAIDNSIDFFRISETWLYDGDSATICA